jgi:hypothetical protein
MTTHEQFPARIDTLKPGDRIAAEPDEDGWSAWTVTDVQFSHIVHDDGVIEVVDVHGYEDHSPATPICRQFRGCGHTHVIISRASARP